MELFDKKFVHFLWDDELAGKVCIVADNMKDLISGVENDGNCAVITNALRYSGYAEQPFRVSLGNSYFYRFAYYDPNYSIKKAFNEGKKIQVETATGEWADVTAKEPVWTEHDKYRVKPEEEKWIAFLARPSKVKPYFASCRESSWETVQESYRAKTKLFIGTKDEVSEWYKSREKFKDVIKAWEDGKEIQVKAFTGLWYSASNPTWNVDAEYRVKPEEKKKEWWEITNPPQIGQIEYYRKDSKIPVGWYPCDGRKMPKEFIGNKAVEELINTCGTPGSMCLPDMRPERRAIYLGKSKVGQVEYYFSRKKVSESSKKKWRPYDSVDEFVKDYQERFLPCSTPAYVMPLIWLRDKGVKFDRELVCGFRKKSVKVDDTSWTMDELFKMWIFLDGSPCGKEC